MLSLSHVCSREALKKKKRKEVFLPLTEWCGLHLCKKKKIRFRAYLIGKKCASDSHYVCQNIIIFMCNKNAFQ